MNRFTVFVQIWLLSFIVCAVAVAVSFARLDVPIALHFWGAGRSLKPLNTAFGSAVILSLESVVALGLILARIVRGHISRFGETLAIACLASICAYGINSGVLKPLLGVPIPAEVVEGARHSFNFLEGSGNSSFSLGPYGTCRRICGRFHEPLQSQRLATCGTARARRGSVGCRSLAFSQRCDRGDFCRRICRNASRRNVDGSRQATDEAILQSFDVSKHPHGRMVRSTGRRRPKPFAVKRPDPSVHGKRTINSRHPDWDDQFGHHSDRERAAGHWCKLPCS